MPTYGSTGGVTARLGSRGTQITAISEPNLTDVGNWLDEAEAEILGAIQQAGGPSIYTGGSRGALILRSWVENRVAGLVRIAHAAAGGVGTNEDGERQEARWQELLNKLRTNAGNILAQLDASGEQPDDSVGPRSHTTDPVLNLTEDDYEPIFTRDQVIYREVF